MKDSLEGQAPATSKDWVSFFKGLPSQNIKWKLTWWDDEEILFSCGDFPNVPLVGARGGVNYNPSIAFKQLAYEQKVPSQESLQPFFFFHGDQTMEWNKRIAQAWKHMCFKGRTELGVRKVYATPEFESWMHGLEGERRPPISLSPNPLMGKKDEKMKEALDTVIAQQKEQIENLVAEKKWQKREIRKNEEEYVQLHRDIRGLKRRTNPTKASQEERLEREVKRLKAEAATSKRKEHEIWQKWAAEKRKNGELQTELRLEKEKTVGAQKEGRELATHLEQEKGASDILQKEIEDMADAHIKRVEELVWSRAEFQHESHELRIRLGQIAQWVNGAVPTFSHEFYRAEDSMGLFHMSPELQNFMGLSRRLIETWDELRRSPV